MGGNTIYNISKLSRVVNFAGLPKINKTISPSDVDFIVEVSSMKKVMVGDTKEKGKDLPTGQRILIENVCKSFTAGGYEAIGFLSYHPPEDNIIDMASTHIHKMYLFFPKEKQWKWVSPIRRQKLISLYTKFFITGDTTE